MATRNKQAAQEPEFNMPDMEEAQEQERDNVQQKANASAELAEMKRKMAELERENEQLRKNSVYAPGPYGSDGDYERVKRACKAAAENHDDPWAIKISVLAPRRGKGEDSYWLGINGRTMQVPADDRYYELALPFAECLVDTIRNERKANDFVDKIPNYDPITNPKKMDKAEQK